jgi:hypothetical protein
VAAIVRAGIRKPAQYATLLLLAADTQGSASYAAGTREFLLP